MTRPVDPHVVMVSIVAVAVAVAMAMVAIAVVALVTLRPTDINADDGGKVTYSADVKSEVALS